MRKPLVAIALAVILLSSCGGDAPTAPAEGRGLTGLDTPRPTRAGKDEKPRDKRDGAKKKAEPTGSTRSGGSETGSSSGGSAASGSDANNGSSEPTPATALPRGTLDYDTDGTMKFSGNPREMPSRTTLTAEEPREGEQAQIRDLRDEDGNGTVAETRLLYRPDGVYLTYVKITATFPGGLTDVRELRPRRPELVAPTDGGPGFKTTFRLEGSGTRADVTVQALREEDVTVGGDTVSTIVARTKIFFSGALEGEQTATSWFWPKHLLAVKEQVHTDVSNGPIRFQRDYEAVITRLP